MAWAHKSIPMLSLLEKEMTQMAKRRKPRGKFRRQPYYPNISVFHWFQLKLGLVIVWGIHP